MATSPLFGWEEPDDTDLVKDGAAAIRTLGNAIDTSMGDLLGGTTGQVLSKASNTDMDFTWAAPTSGDITGVSVTSPITGGGTSGDVTIGISSSAVVPSQSGNSGKYLTTDGTTSSWGTISAGGMTLIATATPTGVSTYTFSSIAGTYKHLLVVVESLGSSAGEILCGLRFNGDTAGNYSRNWTRVVSTTFSGNASPTDQNSIYIGNINCKNSTASERLQSEFWVWDYASSHPLKRASGFAYGRGYQTGADQWAQSSFNSSWNNSSAITSLTIFDVNGPYNFSNGTIKLYGVS